jgi:hypothetical protein
VYAYFRVKRGIIWTKFYLAQTPRHPFEEGFDDLLIGDAEGNTGFTPVGNWPGLDLHPEYSIQAAGPCDGCRDGACTICEMIQTRFTPQTDPGVANQLFEFDLGCISSWRYCSDPAELMPSAWRVYVQEKVALEQLAGPDSSRSWKECHTNLELAGRDYRYVLLTEAVSIKTSIDSGQTRYAVSLHGIKSLKNEAQLGSFLLKQPFIGWSDTIFPGDIRISELKRGSRMILFFDSGDDAADAVAQGPGPCSCVPDSVQNRAAIERGIALDRLSEKD